MKEAYTLLRDKVFTNIGWVKDKSLDSMHGMGVSLSAQALLGIGGTLQYEAVIHNRKMALFCAPGVTAQSDIGVSADIGVIKTLGCQDNQSYSGKFLAINAGVSGEVVGLPLSVGVNYSLGMGISEFLQAMARLRQNGEFQHGQFMLELGLFVKEAYPIMRDENYAAEAVFATLMLSKILSQGSNDNESVEDLNLQLKEHIFKTREEAKDKVLKIRPLSYHIKTILKVIHLMEKDYGMNLPNFSLVVRELDKSLDHCDAVGLTGGLSLSLSPVNAGVTVYQYTMMTEINLDDVMYLAAYTPKTLLTLNLGVEEQKRFIKAITGIMRIIPDIYNNKCAQEAHKRFSRDAINFWDLIN